MSKILIVGPASPYRGGISDLNEAFAKSLVNQGFQVEIISFKLQYPIFYFLVKHNLDLLLNSHLTTKLFL